MWRCFSKRRENIAIKMLEELEKITIGSSQNPAQPVSPMASPHLPTPSASTCMPRYPCLLKQLIIVVLIRALSVVGRGRVLLWRAAR